MRVSGILITILLMCSIATAQKQNNNWVFGYNSGLSFNTASRSVTSSAINTRETTASVSDRHTGKLLFYTDGLEVWDGNHNKMPNGKGVGNDRNKTTAQGAVIIPFANDSNKYYLFTVSSYVQRGELRYSVIDMTLNGGNGDVVSGQKGILISDEYTEGMTAVEHCDIVWLVLVKRYSRDYHAYQISPTGINTTPVVSTANYSKVPRTISTLKISPDRKKMAVCIWGSGDNNSYIGLQDFDFSTGKLSNGIIIDSTSQVEFFASEFSTSGNRLYATATTSENVYQYDLSFTTAQDIRASRKTVQSSLANVGGIQKGPDGNIYVNEFNATTIDMITNVDALFPNCVYTPNAVSVAGGQSGYCFPQLVVSLASRDTLYTARDTTACLDKPITVNSSIPSAAYMWQDGSNSSTYKVNTKGTYWVHSQTECTEQTDTIHVIAVNLSVAINADTVICKGDTVLLSANSQPSDVAYYWSSGSTGATIAVTDAGQYTLQISKLGCTAKDEMSLNIHPKISIELGNNQELCKGDALQLPKTATTKEIETYIWQDGSTQPTFKVTKEGMYRVMISNQCETVYDSILITGRNCYLFFPDAFTPNGDGLNDIARMAGDVGAIRNYELRIFNRFGEVVFLTNDATEGWDGYYKGTKAEVSTYYYLAQYTYLGDAELMKGSVILLR